MTLDEQLELAGKEHLELELLREQLKASESMLAGCQEQLVAEKRATRELREVVGSTDSQMRILAAMASAAEDLIAAAKPFAVKAVGLRPGGGASFVHETDDYIRLAAAYKKLGN